MTLRFLLRKLRLGLVFPLIALLPRSISYAVATAIGYLDWIFFNKSERSEVETQLKTIPNFKNVDISTTSLKYAQLMARDTLDCYRMPKLNAAYESQFLEVVGLEHLVEAERKGKGVLLLVPHYGRYFMLGPALRFLGHGFGVFTTVVNEVTVPDGNWRRYLIRKLKNGFMYCGGDWITSNDSPMQIYSTLKAGRSLLLAFDGVESTSEKKIVFPFLGGEAQFASGALRIANRTKSSLIYVSVKEVDSKLRFELSCLPESPELAFKCAVERLEKDIIDMPWHWWLWRALPRVWELS